MEEELEKIRKDFLKFKKEEIAKGKDLPTIIADYTLSSSFKDLDKKCKGRGSRFLGMIINKEGKYNSGMIHKNGGGTGYDFSELRR